MSLTYSWPQMFSVPAFLAQQAEQRPPLQPLPFPELAEPQAVDPGFPWWLYATVAVVVLGLVALLVWLLMRGEKVALPPMKKPWSAARKRLQDLLAACERQSPPQTAAALSEALRLYFYERYKVPAHCRTTQELFASGAPPSVLSRFQRYAPLADLWDQLAFAPVPASVAEARELVQKALAHLEEDRA